MEGGYVAAMADSKPARKRVRREGGIDTIPRITLPEPSGHTESLPTTLRLAREELGLRQQDVAALLRRDFGIEVGPTAIAAWEQGRNEPNIYTYARWARCVGKRVDMQILDADEDTQTVHVPAELADAAATLGQLSAQKAAGAQAVIEALLEMTAGEVKALAFDLARHNRD